MPNYLDSSGLQVKSLQEIIDSLSDGFRAVYGQDINIDQNTPDAQIINILAQACADNLELLKQIYNSFDPDTATGRPLDLRCAINGVQRRAGTYTHVYINITADRSLTLNGADTDSPYIVSDAQGNQFILETTSDINMGSSALLFRAAELGAVEVLPNTITTPITIVLGVSAVNNPNPATTTGIDEETDAQLRQRRADAVSQSGSGYIDNLRSALIALPDVVSAAVYNNRTDAPDADGVPAHGIWTIVDGGSNADIANVMNAKMHGGAAMRGSVSVAVPQADGSTDTYLFDRPLTQELYINLSIQGIGGQDIPQSYIKQQLVRNLIYKVNQVADAGNIIQAVMAAVPNLSVNCTVSADGETFGLVAETPTKQHKFVLSVGNINITIVNG